MRVGIVSYPMLFQSKGGLQVQILESVRALAAIGVDAQVIDPSREMLSAFDVVHVFSAINGNHRVVEAARSQGVAVVLSPLLREHWTSSLGWRSRILDRLVGFSTGYEVKTEYQHIAGALKGANEIVALGPKESESLLSAFRVDAARITVVENGIAASFFTNDDRSFCESFDISPGFVLCVASISGHKNQLTLARAVQGTGRQLVLIGSCASEHKGYLAEIERLDCVRYVGPLTYGDHRLPSAYRAASVTAIVSQSEVMPLCALEALAAGTPVVLTRNHSMSLDRIGRFMTEVDPGDAKQIHDAIRAYANSDLERASVSASVAHLGWHEVACALRDVYRSAVSATGRRMHDPASLRTDAALWLESNVTPPVTK